MQGQGLEMSMTEKKCTRGSIKFYDPGNQKSLTVLASSFLGHQGCVGQNARFQTFKTFTIFYFPYSAIQTGDRG